MFYISPKQDLTFLTICVDWFSGRNKTNTMSKCRLLKFYALRKIFNRWHFDFTNDLLFCHCLLVIFSRLRCLGKAVHRFCEISWVSSIIFYCEISMTEVEVLRKSKISMKIHRKCHNHEAHRSRSTKRRRDDEQIRKD